MLDKLKKQIALLPPTPGVYVLFDAKKHALWAGAAEHLRREVAEFLGSNELALAAEICSTATRIETIATAEGNLLKHLRAAIFAYRPPHNLALLNETNGYPVLKLTRAKFPRLMASRRADFTEDVETFGAFLPETGVRRRLDFMQRTFRLRSCQLEIDGSWRVPCAEYYFKRCAAPCVENICSENEYAERVNDARLLLRGDYEILQARIAQRIEVAAEELAFERAASLRDLSLQLDTMRGDELWRLDLTDATDTFAWDESVKDAPAHVHLVTTRGRKTLGAQTFLVPEKLVLSAADKAYAFGQILLQHYALYTPRAVRVTRDFPQRKFLQRLLLERVGRKVTIELIPAPALNLTASVALGHTQIVWQTERATVAVAQRNAPVEIQAEFNLKNTPARIVAFDVAHISGSDTVAAMAVWADGELRQHEYQFWLTETLSEPDAMQFALEEFLRELASANSPAPDLVLVDGGNTQLQRAQLAFEQFAAEIPFIAAVKPPQQHKYIARFLRPAEEEIIFNPQSSGHWLLQLLRDEAHNYANAVHRARRELNLLTSKLNTTPVLVPTRLDEPGSNASDLQPLAAFTHDGKLLVKRRAARKERSNNPFAAVRRGHQRDS